MHRELEIESPRYIFGSFFEPLFLNKVFNFDIAQAFGIWKLVHKSVSISVINDRNSGEVRAHFMSSGGKSFAALPFLNLERTEVTWHICVRLARNENRVRRTLIHPESKLAGQNEILVVMY